MLHTEAHIKGIDIERKVQTVSRIGHYHLVFLILIDIGGTQRNIGVMLLERLTQLIYVPFHISSCHPTFVVIPISTLTTGECLDCDTSPRAVA